MRPKFHWPSYLTFGDDPTPLSAVAGHPPGAHQRPARRRDTAVRPRCAGRPASSPSRARPAPPPSPCRTSSSALRASSTHGPPPPRCQSPSPSRVSSRCPVSCADLSVMCESFAAPSVNPVWCVEWVVFCDRRHGCNFSESLRGMRAQRVRRTPGTIKIPTNLDLSRFPTPPLSTIIRGGGDSPILGEASQEDIKFRP